MIRAGPAPVPSCQVVRAIFLRGGGIAELWLHFIALAIMAGVALGASAARFRFNA